MTESTSTKTDGKRRRIDSASDIEYDMQMVPLKLSKNDTADGTVAVIPFKVGDVVWCQLRGHPIWPAQVKEIIDNYATIVWFNDYRTSKVHRTQLSLFNYMPTFTKKNVKQETAIKEALLYCKPKNV